MKWKRTMRILNCAKRDKDVGHSRSSLKCLKCLLVNTSRFWFSVSQYYYLYNSFPQHRHRHRWENCMRADWVIDIKFHTFSLWKDDCAQVWKSRLLGAGIGLAYNLFVSETWQSHLVICYRAFAMSRSAFDSQASIDSTSIGIRVTFWSERTSSLLTTLLPRTGTEFWLLAAFKFHEPIAVGYSPSSWTQLEHLVTFTFSLWRCVITSDLH